MHTHTLPTRVQQYVTRRARTLAVALWLTASAILVPAWLLILRHVLHIGSVNMSVATSGILVAFVGIATLALYWEYDS